MAFPTRSLMLVFSLPAAYFLDDLVRIPTFHAVFGDDAGGDAAAHVELGG